MKNKIVLSESIEIKNFKWFFDISKDVFDILKLEEDHVLWKRSDNNFVLFSIDKWEIFAEEMKNLSWFSEIQFMYNKNASKFIRCLYSRAQPVVLRKNNTLYLWKNNSLRKFLEWKDFSVSFCI